MSHSSRRSLRCGLCGNLGHNRRTCKFQRSVSISRSRLDDVDMSGLKGPKEVVNWLDVNPRRGASPCVLRRKFGHIVTRNKRLADREKELKDLLDSVDSSNLTRSDLAKIAKARGRVQNAQRWLDYSIETMRNALRFAVARIRPNSEDGKILSESRPSSVRGRPLDKKSIDEINYYYNVLEEFQLAKAAVAGHSRSNDALKRLMQKSANLIAHWKFKSGRESDDAEQQAAIGLLEAAKAFDPCHGGYARFTTYASNKIRRRTQVRAAKDCRPGTTLVADPGSKKRRQVTCASFSVDEDGADRVDRFHPNATIIDPQVVFDVRSAIEELPFNDADLVLRRCVKQETLCSLAEELGVSNSKLRGRLSRIKAQLASKLAAYDS